MKAAAEAVRQRIGEFERRTFKGILRSDEPVGRRRGLPAGDVLVERPVAGSLPAVVEHPAVGVGRGVRSLDLRGEGLVVNRGPEAVGERRREVERPPAERKSERALHFGRRIAHDLLFAVVVLVGQLTVPADENLAPVRRIDSRRTHHLERRHRLALLVKSRRKRRNGTLLVLPVLVFQVVADLHDPVPVVAHVEIEIQVRTAAPKHIAAQRQFHAAVADLAQVFLGVRETDVIGLGDGHHQIVGRVVIDVRAAVHTVVPEPEIDAEIPFETALPLQAGIDHRHRHGTDAAVIEQIRTVLVGQLRLIGAESGIADIADAGAQFEQGDRGAPHETLLVEVPAEAQRTERGVFVVVAEFRRAFVTEREIDEIAVAPDVVGIDVAAQHA